MSIFSQRTYPNEVTATLEEHGIDPLFARLYAARGIQEYSDLSLEAKYLLPPSSLKDCEIAAKLLADAIAERDALMKEAREIKDKMINDAKAEAQAAGEKMIAQAKASIESEKNAAMADLKNQVSSLSLEIAEKVLRDELSNKESQTKLVEKMLGDAKLN